MRKSNFMAFAIIAMVLMAALPGCLEEMVDAFSPPPVLPIHICAQSTFSGIRVQDAEDLWHFSEREMLGRCIAQWNNGIVPRLAPGSPDPLQFAGYIDVADFQFDDLFDGKSIVYRVESTDINGLRQKLTEAEFDPDNHSGFGQKEGDGLIFTGEITTIAMTALRINPENTADLTTRRFLSRKNNELGFTFCHEMGHMLGLLHNNGGGIMDTNASLPSDGEPFIRPADVEAFCLSQSARNTCVN